MDLKGRAVSRSSLIMPPFLSADKQLISKHSILGSWFNSIDFQMSHMKNWFSSNSREIVKSLSASIPSKEQLIPWDKSIIIITSSMIVLCWAPAFKYLSPLTHHRRWALSFSLEIRTLRLTDMK